ncbi:MAG: hypothetical protein H0W72_10575 [Planctomycetes bacterium]|nr:hypothetical protein [Planctomycetota bacterium]
MISINALDRGTGLRRLALAALSLALQVGAIVAETVLGWFASARFAPREIAGARLVVRPGMVLTEASGSPERIGEASGALLAGPTRSLLRAMGLFPKLGSARMAQLVAGIPGEHRAELAAFAASAGIDAKRLMHANLVVDTCCSALGRVAQPEAGRPLMVARNMDFFPAAVLGGATLVTVVRPAGRHAFASVGWPGYNAVISGINAHGLTVCILLNYAAAGTRPGTPIAYRARQVLEGATTVDEAAQLFAASPVASSHYLLLADAAGMAVIWQDDAGVHRHDPSGGWLACSNGARDAVSALASDDRGRCLRALAATGGDADDAWLRASMTASYLSGINAQAMLFVPAQRRLQLAIGTGRLAAAIAPWYSVDLAPALSGGSVADLQVTPLGAPVRAAHYAA